MMAKGIFESTNIRGKCLNFVADAELENGMLVQKGGLAAGKADVYQALLPAAATMASGPAYVVGDPAWSYDSSSIANQNEDEYAIPAGKVFRAYELAAGDRFAVGDYGIDGGPVAAGGFVGLQDGSGKPVFAAAEPSGSAFVGKVVSVRELGFKYDVGAPVDTRVKKACIEAIKNG